MTRVLLEVARLMPVDGGALVEVVALFAAAAAAAASSSSSDPLWLLPERLDESLEWLHSVRASWEEEDGTAVPRRAFCT